MADRGLSLRASSWDRRESSTGGMSPPRTPTAWRRGDRPPSRRSSFADGPIDFPHLIDPDILVAMSQGAYRTFCRDVKPESGVILYDRGLVKPEDSPVKQVGVPATEFAVNKLKDKQAANIVLLGALVLYTRIVSTAAIRKAIRAHVSERFRDLNLKALALGLELGRRADG